MTARRLPVQCDRCDAMCCRYVATEIDRPTCKRDYDNIRWYLLHRNVYVFIDHDGGWFIEFETPCECLDADGRCARYTERPRICREHGDGAVDCELHGETAPHVERFGSAEGFEAWLDERGIDWRWRRRSTAPAEG